ncbi:unnamed protein product [Trichobilharzia regenti]|nr:unnamed protein product [Trichobilharzia regenti]
MLSILLRIINSHFSSHGYNILLFIILIILVNYSATGHQSINCLSGCKCSTEEYVTAATCCLIDAQRLSQIATNNNNAYTAIPRDIKQCDINYLRYDAHNANNSSNGNNQLQWPNTGRCLPLWRQLKIQLTQNSWPTLGAITTTASTSRTTSSKCMLQLERLAIVGQSDVYDGLIHLDPYEFRSHLFTGGTTSNDDAVDGDDDGILQLRRLTIEQTSLQRIRQGFFDEIRAKHLNTLEIRRNVNLTDKGLGVGWLANVQHLQSLDLSHNNLYTVNFATWGLPKHYTALYNLYLNDNRIYYLKVQSFNRLPNLTYLNLANNYLSSLSSDVFIGLRRLYLSRNPLASLVNTTTTNTKNSNNNMDTSSQVVWWFTNSCPKLLTSLYLENIVPMNYVKSADTNLSSLQLQLPTFTWEYCESLSDVYLTHNNNWLTCLDRRWLAGGSFSASSSSVSRFRIHPSALEVCPTTDEYSTVTTGSASVTAAGSGNADILTKYDTSGGDASPSPSASASMVGTTHLRTTSISLSSVYWPVPSTEDTAVRVMNIQDHQNTKTKHPINSNNNNNNNHNLVGGNVTTSLNSWIILCLIVLLVFVVFSSVIFGIIYCVRCLNQRFSKQHIYTSGTANNNNALYLQCQEAQQKQFLLQQQQRQNISPNLSNYKTGVGVDGGFSMTTGSSQLLIPYAINNCIDHQPIMKTNQFYPYTDFHPMCNSCFSLKRHAVTQPVSPADSGLEDSTPLALQQTRRGFPSLDRPSTRASRRSRHQHHHNRHRGLLDPVGFTRCPSTSVSSLLLQHSPNHYHCLPSAEISPYCWPPLPSVMNLSTKHHHQHRVINAATSTEDVSIGPASTSPDTSAGDVQSTTPSDAGDKLVSVEKTTTAQSKETETVDIIK